MTNRYNALIVTLDTDIREDDAQDLIAAIKMLRGVLEVNGKVKNMDDTITENRAFERMRERLFAAFFNEKTNGVD